VKRLVALAALACCAWPVLAQDRLVIATPDVVWLEAGEVWLGADESDLRYAAELCRQDLEVPLPAIDRSGCGVERFLPEYPRRRAFVGAFGIDRREVTNAAYRACVRAGACAPSIVPEGGVLGRADHPVVGVRWADAVSFCAWRGGRLPTEAEWEKAARGDDETRRFPWGRAYDSHLANHGRSPLRTDPIDGFLESAPVGSFPDGRSPFGLDDMAGNVWEWTSEPPAMPFEMGFDASAFRAIRGGSYAHPITSLRVTARSWATLDDARADLGLRCAYDRSAYDRAAVAPSDR
jgi:formylglycine-generating enzyme required for sulfatase activity